MQRRSFSAFSIPRRNGGFFGDSGDGDGVVGRKIVVDGFEVVDDNGIILWKHHCDDHRK